MVQGDCPITHHCRTGNGGCGSLAKELAYLRYLTNSFEVLQAVIKGEIEAPEILACSRLKCPAFTQALRKEIRNRYN